VRSEGDLEVVRSLAGTVGASRAADELSVSRRAVESVMRGARLQARTIAQLANGVRLYLHEATQ
jgi:hypothetical protein